MGKGRHERKVSAQGIRARGRSLADFSALSLAELELIAACQEGRECRVGDGEVPRNRSHVVAVRAGLIRFLALGGDEQTPVHECGVQLRGAWVDELLDLSDIEAARPLHLLACNITAIKAEQARLPILNIEGSKVRGGIAADGIRCANGLFMREARIFGEVRLNASDITGFLDCAGARIVNPLRKRGGDGGSGGGAALTANGMKVSGDVNLGEGVRAFGTVSLVGSTIGGDLNCGGARCYNPARELAPGEAKAGGEALSLGGVRVGGNAYLIGGFLTLGQLTLRGADIAGDLDCSDASFKNPGGAALSSDRAAVGGRFFFRNVKAVRGRIELYLMQVASLIDDAASWGHAAGSLVLDGFTYSRIAESPTASTMRIDWLDQQDPDHRGVDFRPQPWEQLVAVLRATGHPAEARLVAIEKQRRLLAGARMRLMTPRIGVPLPARVYHAAADRIGWRFNWLYGKLVGFGYAPVRLLLIMIAAWLVFALAYLAASSPGAWPLRESCSLFAAAKPGSPPPVAKPPTAGCAPTSRFDPWLYSADVVLPIDLGYQTTARPAESGSPGDVLRWMIGLETAAGWLGVALLIAAFTNLIKKD